MRNIRHLFLLWLTDPTPAGLLLQLTLWALVAAVVCVAVPGRSETPVDTGGQQGAAQALSVDRAIDHLTRRVRSHPTQRDPAWRRELAGLVAGAAEAHQIPPLLLTAIVFRESGFRVQARGALGEVGLVQVHGRAADGCELDTARGQLDCGAAWLRHCADRCGSLEGGFALYASGRVCRPDTKHLRSVVADRWRLWAKLERLINGDI